MPGLLLFSSSDVVVLALALLLLLPPDVGQAAAVLPSSEQQGQSGLLRDNDNQDGVRPAAAAAAAAAAVSFSTAVATAAADVPDSLRQFQECGLLEPGFVCDSAAVLSTKRPLDRSRGIERLNTKLIAVRSTTNCSCTPSDETLGVCATPRRGFAISIVLLPTLQLPRNRSDPQSRMAAASQLAHSLRRRFARSQCDDDLLILLSRDDSTCWTSVGKVTARFITPPLINDATQQAEKHFRTGDYMEGLQLMIAQYERLLRGKPIDEASPSNSGWPLPLWLTIALGVMLVAISVACLACCIACFCRTCCCCCRSDKKAADYTLGSQVYRGRESVAE